LLAQGERVSILAIFDDSPPNLTVESEDRNSDGLLVTGYTILRNFPYALKEFIQLGPAAMLKRINRKLRLIRKALENTDSANPGNFDAGDLIDFAAELPPHRQQVITCNFQAIKTYIPQPYPGQVTLFRAKSRQLLDIHGPERGWHKLAPGRVRIHDVPGSHEGMFKKPYVRYLAEKLKYCMDESVAALTALPILLAYWA
jgi:thioesterase domain-containing protein